MGVIVCCLAVVTIFLCREFCVVAQEGFLSIVCGGKRNETDSTTNISWVTDDHFISGGKTANFNDPSLPLYLQTQRIFPKPVNKYCYQLTRTPNVPHLLRIWFAGSNYNEDTPQFYYSIQSCEMLALRPVTIQNPPLPSEKILISNGSELYVCLVRISQHVDPFISAIELRRLNPGMYDVTADKMWSLYSRCDAGSTSSVRYPDDQFGRIWTPFGKEDAMGGEDVSLEKPIAINDTVDLPPTTVMQSALASNNNNTTKMDLDISRLTSPDSLFLLYFAEIREFNMSDSRNFDIIINYNNTPLTTVRLAENPSAVEQKFVFPEPVSVITLSSNISSGTFINALEIYEPIPMAAFTFSGDVQAMNAVKQRVNFSNWVSDPCFGFPWDGINCNNITSAVRVSGINLSGSNLKGSIPLALGNLTAVVNMYV